MERYGRSFRDQPAFSGGFSWPPRSYTCSFCKREFKSAQALGGHMNVHRRDRARLRQSPPLLDPPLSNPNPSPNPNSNPSPDPLPNLNFSPPPPPPPICTSASANKIRPMTYKFPSLLSPRTRCDAMTTKASSATIVPSPFRLRCDELKNTREVKAICFMGDEKIVMARSKREVSGFDVEVEEGLDLELRLGYS